MKSRWIDANRTEHIFLKKNRDWLQVAMEIPIQRLPSAKPGRPSKAFDDLCERSKRRKVQNLKNSSEAEELVYATQMKLREIGNQDAANVVKNVTVTPTRGAKYLRSYRDSTIPPRVQLTPSQALSVFVEANLSRRQYEIIRQSDKTLYPCYTILQRAKKECYPKLEAYQVTATYAEIRLQDLLEHTSNRLILYLEDVLQSLPSEEIASLELVYKWGCDGSQQTEYKQKFENITDSDAYIFQSSLVPLQLFCTSNRKVIWQNPTPSSPRYCRPMRTRFVHETKDISNEEIDYYNEQINNLEETKIARNTGDVSIKHRMLFTMVDGKVCNAATNTNSTMRCYICKATSKDFNNLHNLMFENNVDVENLKFGLSVLHSRIRFFESLLHLSYKLTIQKWQIRTEADKEIVKNRKKEVQEKFKTQLGLIVDVPKAGYGNSNDGNTSRRFFESKEIAAEITGIDLRLIERFSVILEVISSGHKINVEKFSKFCQDTAALYVDLYCWHPMSPTVHKILIHGPLVVQHALLPIGMLSEEAGEARNKYFRQFRHRFSRKFSREQCNQDIVNRLLLTSDPLLSSMRSKPLKRSKSFSSAAIEMFLPSHVDTHNEDEKEIEDLSEQTDEFTDEEECASLLDNCTIGNQ